MSDTNLVVLIGRLTRDAELAYTANGTAVCKFSIAVNRKKKDGDTWVDEPSYFNIVLWGRQGEALNQYLIKGKQVGVSGELRQERWQQDGQNRSKIEVVASGIQLLGGGGYSSDQTGQSGRSNQGSRSNSSYKNSSGSHSAPPSDDGFTDDIPF